MSHPYQPDQPQPGSPSGQDPYGQGQYGQQPTQNPHAPGQYGQGQPSQNPNGQDQPTQSPYGQDQPTQSPYGQGQYGQGQSGQYGQGQPTQNQYGQGQYGQYGQSQPTQGQYGQGQPAQNQYGQGQHGQGQPTQNQYGQGQYGQGQYGQGQYGQDQYGQPLQPAWAPNDTINQPAAGGRKRGILAAAVAVVVVAGGGLSYVAFKDKNSGGGAASPQAAVGKIVTSLSKSDLLGVLDDLPPAERTSIRDSFVAQVSQLKRLNVLDKSADANKVSGVTFAASGLTYGPSPTVVNDHVQLVTVTGGKISVNSDASKVPYTKAFLDAAFDGHAPTQTSNDTIDLAAEAAKSGKPLRIAVQKVGGKWYPSLIYTAVAASVDTNPGAGDAIAPVGASSADDAVRAMITSATQQDYRGLIARLDPNEDAAFHDYGGVLLRHAPSSSDSKIDLKNITFADSSVSGGTRVSLKSVQFTEDGETGTITIDGQCAVLATSSQTTRMCALQALEKYGSNLNLTSAQKAALTDLFAAIPKIGVIATKSGGQWYVSPIRSYADLDISILGNLKDNDLITLIELARHH